jgi:hypothetical protein
MPTFSGKFQYISHHGSADRSGPCQVTFEADTFTLTPVSGPPIVFDLGDIDRFMPGEYDLTLTLYTDDKIVLGQFGKAFQSLTHDLLEAYRQRLVQCLLLEDLEEVARFDGFAQSRSESVSERCFSSPAELRLYKTNLAVLPTAATGLQWRLAEIEAVAFDEASYTLTLRSGDDSLVLSKLAKRTREFRERLEEGIAQIHEKAAQALHGLFPFLTPDQFQRVAALLKEGRAASLEGLQAIHPKLQQALVQNVVDAKLKPYFDALLAATPAGAMYTGFKFIRAEEEDRQESEAMAAEPAAGEGEIEQPDHEAREASVEQPVEDAGAEKEPILHWFFFPLARPAGDSKLSNIVAWEATSRSGRATYFFRLVPPEQANLLDDPARAGTILESAIRQLNRALVLLNFRREPIYLSDEKLEMQPRYRRYAIACRKIPELRRLRASFLGRAIHTSPLSWRRQVGSFLVHE